MGLKGEIVEKRGCCSVEWKIKDFFLTSHSMDDFWTSPLFYNSNATWCLLLYPDGEAKYHSNGWIGMHMRREVSNTEIHEFSCVFGVKASDGTKIKSRTGTAFFKESGIRCGWNKFCERKELLCEKDKLFPDGAVIFFCDADLIVGENGADDETLTDSRRIGEVTSYCNANLIEDVNEVETQTDSRSDFFRLTQNFKDLLLGEADADVTVKVKDKEFRAHSLILSARSPVLAAMFRHDTKEKKTGVVEIPEYEPDSIREFLIFLYSGQTDKLSIDNVVDLYSAADKYDMEDLKTRCFEFMKENMSVDSICSFLSVAITYDDKDLLDMSTNFFLENVKKIIVTVKWMSFAKKYPVQSNELVIRIAHRFIPD